jgi:hypothetical protein
MVLLSQGSYMIGRKNPFSFYLEFAVDQFNTKLLDFGKVSNQILKNRTYKLRPLRSESDLLDCSNFCINFEVGKCDMFFISVI